MPDIKKVPYVQADGKVQMVQMAYADVPPNEISVTRSETGPGTKKNYMYVQADGKIHTSVLTPDEYFRSVKFYNCHSTDDVPDSDPGLATQSEVEAGVETNNNMISATQLETGSRIEMIRPVDTISSDATNIISNSWINTLDSPDVTNNISGSTDRIFEYLQGENNALNFNSKPDRNKKTLKDYLPEHLRDLPHDELVKLVANDDDAFDAFEEALAIYKFYSSGKNMVERNILSSICQHFDGCQITFDPARQEYIIVDSYGTPLVSVTEEARKVAKIFC